MHDGGELPDIDDSRLLFLVEQIYKQRKIAYDTTHLRQQMRATTPVLSVPTITSPVADPGLCSRSLRLRRSRRSGSRASPRADRPPTPRARRP